MNMSDIEKPQITIADIATLKQIVEVASSRGAFRAEELSQIGAVYDRVSAWIEVVTQLEATEDTEQQATDDTEQQATEDTEQGDSDA